MKRRLGVSYREMNNLNYHIRKEEMLRFNELSNRLKRKRTAN